MITPQQSLTENFYHWEKRGRGWKVWDAPVELEPAFAPFVHSYFGPLSPAIDDGRKPTRVGSWFEKMKGRLSGVIETHSEMNEYSDPASAEPEPEYFYDNSPLVEIQI